MIGDEQVAVHDFQTTRLFHPVDVGTIDDLRRVYVLELVVIHTRLDRAKRSPPLSGGRIEDENPVVAGIGDVQQPGRLVDVHVRRNILDPGQLGSLDPADDAVRVVVVPDTMVIDEIVAHDMAIGAIVDPVDVLGLPGDPYKAGSRAACRDGFRGRRRTRTGLRYSTASGFEVAKMSRSALHSGPMKSLASAWSL